MSCYFIHQSPIKSSPQKRHLFQTIFAHWFNISNQYLKQLLINSIYETPNLVHRDYSKHILPLVLLLLVDQPAFRWWQSCTFHLLWAFRWLLSLLLCLMLLLLLLLQEQVLLPLLVVLNGYYYKSTGTCSTTATYYDHCSVLLNSDHWCYVPVIELDWLVST